MSITPYACWAISAAQPEHVVRQFEQADRELAALRARTVQLQAACVDMVNAASDLGIHPAAIVDANGVETVRTERQSGFNDAVMQLGAAIDIIAARVGIEPDQDAREDAWCWSKPLEQLRADSEALQSIKRIVDMRWDASDQMDAIDEVFTRVAKDKT